MAGVILRGLAKRYGDVRAIDAVDLDIDSGEFVTLLGPSGCGKTTLLRAVAGLVAPDAGTVAIDGAEVTRTPVNERDLGMVFQSPALFPHMTVARNVAFGLKMRGVSTDERDRRVAAALELMRMGAYGERMPRALSGGQQQRVAIARALVIDPRVLLMDEPFSALDRKLREAMQVELRDLTRRLGITVLFVTHDQDEAMVLSDRIAVMHEGRLQQVGTAADVYERPATRFVADFMGVGNLLPAIVGETGERGLRVSAEGLTLHARGMRAPGTAVTIGLRAERITLVGTDEANVTGVVRSVIYQGGTSRLLVALDPDARTTLEVRSSAPGFAAGQRVGLQWRTDDVLLLDDSPVGDSGDRSRHIVDLTRSVARIPDGSAKDPP